MRIPLKTLLWWSLCWNSTPFMVFRKLGGCFCANDKGRNCLNRREQNYKVLRQKILILKKLSCCDWKIIKRTGQNTQKQSCKGKSQLRSCNLAAGENYDPLILKPQITRVSCLSCVVCPLQPSCSAVHHIPWLLLHQIRRTQFVGTATINPEWSWFLHPVFFLGPVLLIPCAFPLRWDEEPIEIWFFSCWSVSVPLIITPEELWKQEDKH